MNEQIKEIAKQSGLWFVTPREDLINDFAEAILKECLGLCESVRDDAAVQKKSKFLTESGRQLYEGVWGGANNCGYVIEQHFGVNDE